MLGDELIDHVKYFFKLLWIREVLHEFLQSTLAVQLLEFSLSGLLFSLLRLFFGFRGSLGFELPPLLVRCKVFALVELLESLF
jgi:hypothetical protein